MSLEKQIAEVFDPAPVDRDAEICALLEASGIADLDTVGEFLDPSCTERSPIGEFYWGRIIPFEGPEYICDDGQNELILELKKLRGGHL